MLSTSCPCLFPTLFLYVPMAQSNVLFFFVSWIFLVAFLSPAIFVVFQPTYLSVSHLLVPF